MTTQTGLVLRAAEDRGHEDHGWLKSAHSFSFAQYHDPKHMGFGPLRVINDDHVAAGQGFPMHPHQNYEIFSYILEGQLEHQDSLGNGSVVNAGGVQYMSAGSGVRHSEFNPSQKDAAHFLQVWVQPNVLNETPHYETMDISAQDKDGKLALFLSHNTANTQAIAIKADIDIYAATLRDAQYIETSLDKGRLGWVQVARGNLVVNSIELRAGDGLAIKEAQQLKFEQGDEAEFLYFDMAP